MGILKNALRERIRRKDMYVVVAIGLLIILLCMSGAVTLEIDGVPVTDAANMLPLLLNIIAVIGGAVAIALSLRTIPNEYERKTSHLIWIRGISQRSYHGQLAAANVISSLAALFVMYAAVLIFALVKGEMQIFLRGIPGFFLFAIGTAGVSLFTSALSLFMSAMAAGTLSAAVMLGATMHPVLETMAGLLSGISGKVLHGISAVLPDLYSVAEAANAFVFGENVRIQPVVDGLLFCYLGYLILFLYKRKEA